jgi:type IV secretion system protein VirD4
MPADRLHQTLALVHQYTPLVKYYWPRVLLGLGAVLLLTLVLRLLRGTNRADTRLDARWASRRDLRLAYLLGKTGIVLGRLGRLVVRYVGRGHVFVVAPTQSGKSQSIVKTTLLEAQPTGLIKVSMLINDPKGELYPTTAPYRGTVSRVIHLAPTSWATDHYNPCDAVRMGEDQETADLQLFAELLVNPEGIPITSEGSLHYIEMTKIVVRGLTAYGLLTGAATSLGEFYVLVTQGQLADTLKAMAVQTHPAIRQATQLLQAMDEKQYDGVITTLMRVYQLYGDPQLGEMVSYSDFALPDLRQGVEPVTVYLSIPFAHLTRLRPLVCLCFNQWLGHVTEAPPNWRTLGWHRVLVMGEEFPSLKHLTIAKDIMNQGAGLGVQLCLITPSLNDIEAIWGTHHNFLDNAHVQAFFSVSDERLAQRLSQRLGTHTVRKKRLTWSRLGRSWTIDIVKEPLMDVSTLLHMHPDNVLILSRDQQTMVEQLPWDTHQPWKSRGVTPV